MSRLHGPQTLRHWCANADHTGKVLNTLASPQHCCWAQEVHRQRHMPDVPGMCSTVSPTALGRRSLQTQTRSARHCDNFIFTVSQSPEQQSPAWGPGRPGHARANPQGDWGPGWKGSAEAEAPAPGRAPAPQAHQVSTASPRSLEAGHSRGWRRHPATPRSQSARCAYTNSDGKVVAVYQVRRPPHQAPGLVAQVHQHPPQGPGLAQGPLCSVLGV